MSKRGGYSERTLVHPRTHVEVYGADGYGWYTYADDVDEVVGRTRGIEKRPSVNPLFVYMDGMTAAKLRGKGFRA